MACACYSIYKGDRDPPIMLKILPIMLCCTAQKLYPLCSNNAQATIPMLCL